MCNFQPQGKMTTFDLNMGLTPLLNNVQKTAQLVTRDIPKMCNFDPRGKGDPVLSKLQACTSCETGHAATITSRFRKSMTMPNVKSYLILVIFSHIQNFWKIKFTPKNA